MARGAMTTIRLPQERLERARRLSRAARGATMKIYRTPEQIDDRLYPECDRIPRDARTRALLDVLCRIPDVDYRRLIKRFEKLDWFIPEAEKSSGFYFFDAHMDIQLTVGDWSSPRQKLSVVVYLSPALEALSPDALRNIVADKLAHIVLGQEVFFDLDEKASKIEKDARIRKVRIWGVQS